MALMTAGSSSIIHVMTDRPRSSSGTPINATPAELVAVSKALSDLHAEYVDEVGDVPVPEGGWQADEGVWPEFTVGAPDPDEARRRIIAATS